ncbi:hypothetical protein RvY_05449-2 [Ramazzottius varieornatus]|uniref:Uncharacterized protein n=1 Tax=Ramazzottius varieornatus TaxID=947166 RepID=A0A1D1UY43_RAMVA|nr:hypothetical protein RvY_05449-2 [Ramazzottius varieornatus]
MAAIIHMLKFLTPPENALPVTDQILSIWRFFDPELSTREQCTKEQLSFLETFEARETIRTLTKNNRVLETKIRMEKDGISHLLQLSRSHLAKQRLDAPSTHVGGLPGLPAGVTNSPAAVLAPPVIMIVPDAVVEYAPEEARVEQGAITTTKIVGLDNLDDSSFLNWLMMPSPGECSRESSSN